MQMDIQKCRIAHAQLEEKVKTIVSRYSDGGYLDYELLNALIDHCYQTSSAFRGRFMNIGIKISELGRAAKSVKRSRDMSKLLGCLVGIDTAILVHTTAPVIGPDD